ASNTCDQFYRNSHDFQNNTVPYEEFLNIMPLIDNQENMASEIIDNQKSVISEIINGMDDKNSHEISYDKNNKVAEEFQEMSDQTSLVIKSGLSFSDWKSFNA
ncbi:3682_t:CDS:1, partial [Gigaspora rosea]